MSLSLLAPYSLKKFQLEFGDYLRLQRQSQNDSIPNRVGKVYQDLIFNNVCGFLNQCFPICKKLLGDDKFRTLCLYFFQRYPTHSPYFTEIPMQFVEFVSQILNNEQDNWLSPLSISDEEIDFIPKYLDELAHYEWLELFVDTMPNNEHKLILKDDELTTCYALNSTVQNCHYTYPVQTISPNNANNIMPSDTCLVVLRVGVEVKFVAINVLTYFFIDFLKECHTVYTDKKTLLTDFANSIDYPDIDGLINFADDLFLMLSNEQILIKQ
ncbi:HvfC family RiPP maturation protein [Moraxella nasicaprae]|uniref:DNA-binding domain-containing protein n=1 Tax=Moraxella nasicaprae TaxID=2904122 RepID=A0ABY6F6S1_9GAMM|nr:DNA-binding domain-containing protein [Moraxella nasicaprae]UXZ05570.1 DNA-binding domain-containing protein [Moraxella nasicaprae]